MTKCPKCGVNLDIHLTAAPPMQSEQHPVDVSEIGELLERIEDEALSPWEQTFVADMRERWEKYGVKIRVSEKQMATLEKIASE